MKRLFLTAIFLTLSCISTFAQREVGKGELSWQYSVLSREFKSVDMPNVYSIEREYLPQGFGVSVSGNLTKAVAIVGDVSYNWSNSSKFSLKSRDFIFLSGPRFYLRGDSFSVFGQVMAGVARRTDEFSNSSRFNLGQLISIKDTDFALGFGAGADITLSKRVSLRVFQLDFIPTHNNDVWLKNYRIKTGIVFRFDYFK